jgi:hypothetical protein
MYERVWAAELSCQRLPGYDSLLSIHHGIEPTIGDYYQILINILDH